MVKCANCGFLAILPHRHGRQLESASADERGGGGGSVNSEFPICAAKAVSLRGEIFHDKQPHATLRTIQKDRDCSEFIEWDPCYSLKDHADMKQVLEQREFNRQMAESDRAWKEQDRKARETEAGRVEDRHQQNARAAERRFWIGIVCAVIGTIAGQAAMERLGIGRGAPAPAPQVIVVPFPSASQAAQANFPVDVPKAHLGD